MVEGHLVLNKRNCVHGFRSRGLDLAALARPGNREPPGYRPDDPRSTWNLTASDSDRNQRPLGHEPSSGSATLRQQFHPIEGAPSSVMRFSLARFATESKCEGTSTVRPLSRTRP